MSSVIKKSSAKMSASGRYSEIAARMPSPPSELGHGQDDRAADGERIADLLNQRGNLHFAHIAAVAGAVVTVQHRKISRQVFNRVKRVDARAAVVIAGEENRALAVADAQPDAAGAVTAASPRDVQPAGQRRLVIGHAQSFENNRIDHRMRELARGFRRHHDAAGKAVVQQVFKRAGLVFMRMADEKILRGADVLGAQVGRFIPRVAALIAAVDDEDRFAAFNDIAVALLAAGFSGQIELHERPPCLISRGLSDSKEYVK